MQNLPRLGDQEVLEYLPCDMHMTFPSLARVLTVRNLQRRSHRVSGPLQRLAPNEQDVCDENSTIQDISSPHQNLATIAIYLHLVQRLALSELVPVSVY